MSAETLSYRETGSPKESELPEGMRYVHELTDKHITQLIAYSTDPDDEGVQGNTLDAIRFKDRDAVLEWKEKGRSTTIITNDEGDLLALSWFGAKDMYLDEYETNAAFNPQQYGATFAVRIYGEARGKRLSGKIIQKAEEQFQTTQQYKELVEQGQAHPWLEVSADNIAGVKSYDRLGYRSVTEPNQDNKILMVRPPLQ